LQDETTSMATRAAWLHYVGGMTQAAVAKRLGVTGLKAHRLISRANHDGLVRFSIEGEIAECSALEDELCRRYNLAFAQVAPDIQTDDLALRTLGMAGAQFLKREIEGGEARLIGVGNGRTLAACIAALPRMAAGDVRFVSLLGGLTRKFSANPHDVIHRLAERTDAEAYFMPVPLFANTSEDRAVLFEQKGVQEVLDLARSADLLFAGIGTSETEASLVATGMIEKDEMRDICRRGGVGELLGHFFDAAGRRFETGLSNRTMTLDLESLRKRRVVAIGGGPIKVKAIAAVLASGCLQGLITDERSARALTARKPVG
jgi:DNA-binding transcriptional regulator LsrR (DeoR family)